MNIEHQMCCLFNEPCCFQVFDMFEDLNWEDGDAAYFSAWLLPMLVTNPQARATAAQSARHPVLEPMDLEVEEGEMPGTS